MSLVLGTRNYALEVKGDIKPDYKEGAYDPRSKMKLRPSEGEIILGDLDFFWWPEQINSVVKQWGAGIDIRVIARSVRGSETKDVDETALLLMHLTRRGKIKPRPSGVFGEGR